MQSYDIFPQNIKSCNFRFQPDTEISLGEERNKTIQLTVQKDNPSFVFLKVCVATFNENPCTIFKVLMKGLLLGVEEWKREYYYITKEKT